MRRTKVLHLITHMGVGGATDNTLLTIEGASRDEFEVHAAAGQLEEGYSSWEDRARESAEHFYLFPELQRSVAPRRDVRALRRLTNFIREQQYDIVHTHCAKAGILGRLAARRAGVPHIVHTYHLFGWESAHTFHRYPWRNALARLKRGAYYWAERYAASQSDALITVSKLNRHEAIACKLAPAHKLTNIYSGIDLGRFDITASREEVCRRLDLDPQQPIVATIGRCSMQKAPLDFVAAAKAVLRRNPKVQFIMVGDGPMCDEVQQAIGNESRIRLLGFLQNVPEVLSVLDVFALSSLWEGLGRALTEAMIMACPVAATSVAGMPELVHHQETGLLSSPRDPNALAENILWLLDHRGEALAMGQRGRELVVPAFCDKRMVEQIEALYRRLMGIAPSDVQAAADSPIGPVLTPDYSNEQLTHV